MEGAAPRFELRRWRWRLTGASQWPLFALFAAGDIVLVHELPFQGEGMNMVDAFVVAGALNLLVVAALGPLAGAALRRRRPDLPRVVAADHAGAVLLVALFLALLGAGLAHASTVDRARREYRAQSDAVRRYVDTQAPARYRAHLDAADTWELEPHLYRTCVPSGDPERALCLYVDTSEQPPGLSLDPSEVPNDRLVGARSPGRLGG